MIYIPAAIIFIIGLIIKAIFETRKYIKNQKILDEIEKNKPEYNYYRILPFDVQELEILQFEEDGRYRLTLTPTNIQQVNEFIFLVGVKAKFKGKDIGFDLIFNNIPQVEVDKKTGEEFFFNVFSMATNSVIADNFLKVMAMLFETEIGNKTQIVREVVMVTEEKDFSLDNIQKPMEILALFADKAASPTTPSIYIGLNLQKGEVIIEETDPIFRPIIINRWTFKPNIKT